MQRIKARLIGCVFSSPDGYGVYNVITQDDKRMCACGVIINPSRDVDYILEGDFVMHPKFGKQFKVSSAMPIEPSTQEGILAYLANGNICGIGPVLAKRIVKMFGDKTMDIIDNSPEKLMQVTGVGRKKYTEIMESWKEDREIRQVMIFLQGNGITPALAVKIYNKFGLNSISKIKNNPYVLTEITGVGFKNADKIARNMGFDIDDPRRCRAGLLFVLEDMSMEGHVFATMLQLTEKAVLLLDISETNVLDAVEYLVRHRDIIIEESAVYLSYYYNLECDIAKMVFDIMNDITTISVKSQKKTYAAKGVKYDKIQLEAIHMALKSNMMILTGGPGTGKTTTTLGIIKAFLSQDAKVLLAAPTGRAAKRMKETTSMEALTIHRLLEYKKNGYERNAENPLQGDVLIVDEMSMVDINLMYNLLLAVPKGMRIILVGDVDQLPSVGPGNVLNDLIASNVIPVVKLTTIFRQAQSSMIITNAHRINSGLMPCIDRRENADFFFIEENNPEEAAKTIVNLVTKRLPKAYSINSHDIQVLAPMKRYECGTINLNRMLQSALNENREFIKYGDYEYKKDDTVMQTKNNYDKGVFNGDIGKVTEIDGNNLVVVYENGNEVKYKYRELDHLTLAYAITIHKSQGNEHDYVVIPVLSQNFIMLQRNLIYTAITRAKKICILIGEKKALKYAVDNIESKKRNTGLANRIGSLFKNNLTR